MLIHGIIVHKIEKAIRERQQPNPKSVITPRANELPSDSPLVIELVEYVWNAYRTGKTFGSFDSDVDNHPVQNWLNTYIDDPDENPFIPLTNSIMNRLKIYLDEENFATGGHLLFIHFTENEQPWFMVVMIKDKKGFLFTEDLDLQDVKELDLDKLRQAVRVDINKWKENTEKAYLSFIKSGSGDVANYFLNTFGCTDSIQSKEVTRSVLSAVEKVCGDSGLNRIDTRQIKDNVCNYMEQNLSGVSLAGVGIQVDSYLPEEHWGEFMTLANSEDYSVSDTFEPNRQILTAHRRIKYDAPHWKVSVDRDALGTPDSDSEVVYDKEDKSLTIKQVPDQLAVQLLETLQTDEQD
jgi:nucleoid-associated protein